VNVTIIRKLILRSLVFVVLLSVILFPPHAGAQDSTVPDVTGLGVPQAAALLNRNGLRLGAQTGEPWTEASGLAANTISAQAIAPGQVVTPGTAVDVTVLRSPNVLLVYNQEVITLINQTGAALDLTAIQFNTVDGSTPASFPASTWTATLNPGDRCVQLWAVARTGPERPPACSGVDRWLSTAKPSVHFWTGAAGATHFNVVQGGIERAVCETAAAGGSQCAFYVPSDAASADVTDYIYLVYTTERLVVLNQSTDRWMPLSGIFIYSYNPNLSVPGAELPAGDPALFNNPDTVADITRLAPGQCLLYSNSNQDAAYPPQDCDVIARLDINPKLIFWAANFEIGSVTDGQRHTCPAATEGKLTICIMPR
jgi:hypothetical protein